MSAPKPATTYASAGVSIDAGNALVKEIGPLAKATARAGSTASLGGFGALFDLKACGYRDPLLVATTDGVGTKLKVAIEAGYHDGVGIDLVAMCVNDLIAQGAEPLLFLDYYATGKLEVKAARAVIAGIADGCKQAGCALVGGETAEMPGMYHAGDYDLAGFAVGAVERDAVLPRRDVQAGDVVVGIASHGVHSNGFSLVRKIVTDAGLDYQHPAPFAAAQTLGRALLTPTRIYVKPALAACKAGYVKALAHITGGGLLENIPRVLPEGLGVRLNAKAWQPHPVFSWLAKQGQVAPQEMARTFNCGIGLVLVVEAKTIAAVQDLFTAAGDKSWVIGQVEANSSDHRVQIDHMDAHWPC